MDLGLGLEGTHVLVTGGAGLIGSVVVSAFLSAGADVTSLDISHSDATEHDRIELGEAERGRLTRLPCDITSETSTQQAWDTAVRNFGTVETCIALASLDLSVLPQTDSLCDMDPATWGRVLNTNVGGTFLTAQFWLRGIREHGRATNSRPLKNPGLIMIGSEAGHFGVRTQAAYSASKSAVQYGLLQSLRADAPRINARARVNVVAPGPVDTVRFRDETGGPGSLEWWTECEATTALKQPVPTEAVARSILFLASERWSGNVHGQALNVDSGKQGALMWPLDADKAGKVLQDG
ncbi:hypothetical protein MBLNU459_g3166t1 [Dothideomycetes sp. NU459]